MSQKVDQKSIKKCGVFTSFLCNLDGTCAPLPLHTMSRAGQVQVKPVPYMYDFAPPMPGSKGRVECLTI